MQHKKQNAWAVVYTYESSLGSREDCLDSWFKSKRLAQKKLIEQRLRYPSTSEKNYLFVCPVIAWQDEHNHWHIQRIAN